MSRISILIWLYPPWFCLREARADKMDGLLLEYKKLLIAFCVLFITSFGQIEELA